MKRSEDGVFTREEKSAANFASGLSKDALDLSRMDYNMAEEESKQDIGRESID